MSNFVKTDAKVWKRKWDLRGATGDGIERLSGVW